MRRTTMLAFVIGLLIGLSVAGGVAILWMRAEQARSRAEWVLERQKLELRQALEDMDHLLHAKQQKPDKENK